MEYEKIKKNRKNFLSNTSLEVEEFEYLLEHFTPIWENYYRHYTTEGKKRKIISHTEHKSALLQTTPQKLFFLLVYLKNNPLQTFQAAIFNVSQSKVSKITSILLKILDQTLAKMNLSPCRDGAQLQHLLHEHPTKTFTYDGMERGIQRNTDIEAQKEDYSGKKKTHCIKNNILCDDAQYIHYLSPTENGTMHDKKIADEYPMLLPKGSILRQDTGFIGHNPVDIIVEIPFKKPRKKELSFSQLLYNQMLSPLRVVIEHVNSGIKRLRMLKDTIRLKETMKRDMVIAVACALHNFRTLSPSRNYKPFKPLLSFSE